MKPKPYLSQNNIACIRYGKWLGRVLAASRRIRAMRKGEIVAYDIEGEKARFAQLLARAREARARIFRECGDCAYGDDWLSFCMCNNKHVNYGGKISHEKACTCPFYEERREE